MGRNKTDEFEPRSEPSPKRDLESELRSVQAAAKRGAHSVSVDRQIISDAIEIAICQWQAALLKGRRFDSLDAWAYRVAVNAAKSLGISSASTSSVEAIGDVVASTEASDVVGAGAKRLIRAHLVRHRKNLRGRQFEVLSKFCEPGMTLNLAAKSLGMDRRSLRRSFRSGLARLMRG